MKEVESPRKCVGTRCPFFLAFGMVFLCAAGDEACPVDGDGGEAK